MQLSGKLGASDQNEPTRQNPNPRAVTRKREPRLPAATHASLSTPQPVAGIQAWHAHVYYDADSRDRAALLRAWVEKGYAVRVGRWHDTPVGPHPRAMFQILFSPDIFPDLVPFLPGHSTSAIVARIMQGRGVTAE